jgi:F-type H+-transporting ATPase subunit epsilon
MKLSIITPEKVIFKDNDIKRVTFPTSEGEMTVLPGHAPLVVFLTPGELIVEDEQGARPLAVSGGFVEVTQKHTKILADTAETVEEIDLTRAQEARDRAQKLVKEKKFDAREFTYLTAKIEKELSRIRVGKKYKKIKPPLKQT